MCVVFIFVIAIFRGEFIGIPCLDLCSVLSIIWGSLDVLSLPSLCKKQTKKAIKGSSANETLAKLFINIL